MAKFRDQKTSFLGGEISATAHGRTDLPFYKSSCKTLRNMIPLLSGGAYRRPGTYGELKFAADTVYAPRVIPFTVSKSEVYAVVITKSIAGVNLFYVVRPSADAPTSPFGSTVSTVTGAHPWGPALAGTATTLGYYDEWHEVQYVQSADVMILVHSGHIPQRLSRTATDTFNNYDFDTDSAGTKLTLSTFRDSYPFLDQNTTATTLTINTAAVGVGRTLTASTAIFAGDSTDVGRIFKVFDGAVAYACAIVTAAINTTSATVTVKVAFGDTAAHATWWESAWSDYQGWPRSVAYFQGRRIYGGTKKSPDSIWFSATSAYTTMSVPELIKVTSPGDGTTTGPAGSQPFTAVLSSQQLNQIQWISPEKTLLVGTAGDEWVVDKADPTAGFGANNINAVPTTHFGSTYVQAQRMGDELVFCAYGDQDLRGLIFNIYQNNYTDEAIQLLFDEFPHIESSMLFNRKIRGFSWDNTRKTLWCVDTTGHLAGFTRDRTLQISAWHSHQMGGYNTANSGGSAGSSTTLTIDPIYSNPAGSVISVAVIPNPLIGMNDVWLTVKRYINGAYCYFVERMVGGIFPYETAYNKYGVIGRCFTDCSFYSPTIFSGGIVNNLIYLNGEIPYGTYSNANGLFEVTGSVVTAGSSTIDGYTSLGGDSVSSSVTMGLPFSCIVEPVRIEAGSQLGNSQGALKRTHLYTVRFYRTLSCKMGRDASNLEAFVFRTGDTAMAKSPELFTGDKKLNFEMDYDTDGYVYILQDKALPFAIISIIAEGMEYD